MPAPSRLLNLPDSFDLVVIGGGSTGAAVLREATRAGVRALLVEKRDFASGTSSRSTKLAQGGLRYLDTGDLKLVRQSIVERDRLAREAPGLAAKVPFTALVRADEGRRGWKARIGVAAYALLGGERPSAELSGRALDAAVPGLEGTDGVRGAGYGEAPIDDARLVLRLLFDAVDRGATALNYVSVQEILPPGEDAVAVRLRDELDGSVLEIRAKAVVNATGAWAGELPGLANAPRLRPIRGSHLLVPRERFPLDRGVSFRHPRDRRWVCAVPWEDVVVVGTTEHEHTEPLDRAPVISEAETSYLLEALSHGFPGLRLTRDDVVSTFAGVRPIADLATASATDASREHHVFAAGGVVTITGGKLTTCRAMARDALKTLQDRLPALASLRADDPFLDPPTPCAAPLPAESRVRLEGRHGARTGALAKAAKAGELARVPGTSTLWAELRYAARSELVVHLDDLLLRRVRVGLFLREGGEAVLDRVRGICMDELGWDEARWQAEVVAYRQTWAREHAVPAAPESAKTLGNEGLPRLRMVDAGGPVHVADFGGSGPTVVLLHGVGGGWQNWMPSAPMLAESARVLAVDLVGCGRTPRADRSQGIDGQLEMLEKLLAREVGGPAVLVGNSLGGLLALGLAARAPQLVDGLVLVSPAQPPPSWRDVDPSLALRGALHVMPGVGEVAVWNDARRKGARGLFLDLLSLGCVDVARVPAQVVEANTAMIEERMKLLGNAHTLSYFEATRSLVAMLARRSHFDAWVRAVRAPTLVVHGRGDRLVPVQASRELLRQRTDWDYAELPDLGHVPQMEDAETFVATVRGWLVGQAVGRALAG